MFFNLWKSKTRSVLHSTAPSEHFSLFDVHQQRELLLAPATELMGLVRTWVARSSPSAPSAFALRVADEAGLPRGGGADAVPTLSVYYFFKKKIHL
jgi:hypothetical protein